MLVIDHNPGHIVMGRIELVSQLRHLVHDVVAFLACSTGIDGGPVHTVLGSTALSLGVEVSGVVLEADREGEALGVVVEFADGACLNEVALALAHSVLAGEGPAGSVLSGPGVSVGDQVELADLPEILGVGCSLE